MICKIACSLAILTALFTVSPTMGWSQTPPGGERFSLVLSGDPVKWEQSLNEVGSKG